MWNKLSPADLEQAKQQLKGQREVILHRLRGLLSEQAEIETLDRLIGAFAMKFKNAIPSAESIAATGAHGQGQAEVISLSKSQDTRSSGENFIG